MYILYGGPLTRGWITEAVLAEGDIPYELRVVDIVAGGHRTPEFLAVNPAGLVPVLITPEGETLTETPAINLWLAERHGLDRIAPRADEPERGAFLGGLFFLTSELEPALKRYFYAHRLVLRPEDLRAVRAQALTTALDLLGLIEARLAAGGPYHLGARFSLVDLTLAYWTTFLDRPGMLDALPATRRCVEQVRARPGLAARLDDLALERDEYAELLARGQGVR